MMSSKAMITVALAVTVGFAVGCKSESKEDPKDGLPESTAEAEKRKAALDFERSGDPPINADTYFAAGQLAETQNLVDRAVQQYNLALKRDPNHRGALFRLGTIQAERKQFQDAVATWKRYVKVTNSAEGYSNLGYCYELWGKRAEAEEAYKRGIARDPHSQPCRVNYGLMLARNGQTAEANAQLAAVLSPAEVQYNLGSVYEQLGQRDNARAAYTKALQLDPSMREAKARLDALK